MTMRYVPALKSAIMVMPMELHELATRCGKVSDDLIDCDFFCPMLHLLHLRNVTPDDVTGESYLQFKPRLMPLTRKRRVGLAWSIGKLSDGDYPREISLELLVEHLGHDVELHSVQTQGAEQAEQLGVATHEFADFADCAETMLAMDEVISVDTAALHLAGAIGHPKVTGLLSSWASWRWQANWYDNVTLLRQSIEGDWTSALAQR
jgi:hypothetical protein